MAKVAAENKIQIGELLLRRGIITAEQIEEILGMPEIYKKLVSLMEISHFESHEIVDKALTLEHLFHEYINY